MLGAAWSGVGAVLKSVLRGLAQVFSPDEKIDTIDDRYWVVRAEPVPPEEVDPPQHSRRIHVYHFNLQQNNNVRPAIHALRSVCAGLSCRGRA